MKIIIFQKIHHPHKICNKYVTILTILTILTIFNTKEHAYITCKMEE